MLLHRIIKKKASVRLSMHVIFAEHKLKCHFICTSCWHCVLQHCGDDAFKTKVQVSQATHNRKDKHTKPDRHQSPVTEQSLIRHCK